MYNIGSKSQILFRKDTKKQRIIALLRMRIKIQYEHKAFLSVKKEKRSVEERVILIKMISSFIARRRVVRKCIRVYDERLQSASEKRSHTSKFRQCAPCTDGRPARPVHFRSRRTADRPSRGNINALRTRIFCL